MAARTCKKWTLLERKKELPSDDRTNDESLLEEENKSYSFLSLSIFRRASLIMNDRFCNHPFLKPLRSHFRLISFERRNSVSFYSVSSSSSYFSIQTSAFTREKNASAQEVHAVIYIHSNVNVVSAGCSLHGGPRRSRFQVSSRPPTDYFQVLGWSVGWPAWVKVWEEIPAPQSQAGAGQIVNAVNLPFRSLHFF